MFFIQYFKSFIALSTLMSYAIIAMAANKVVGFNAHHLAALLTIGCLMAIYGLANKNPFIFAAIAGVSLGLLPAIL